MTTKLGPAGYAVAIHALITELMSDPVWVDALHPATVTALTSAQGSCAVEAGDPQPVEDADALLLAAGLLGRLADRVVADRLDCIGELECDVAGGVFDARERLADLRKSDDD